jgi:hypothetical protein
MVRGVISSAGAAHAAVAAASVATRLATRRALRRAFAEAGWSAANAFRYESPEGDDP